MTGRRPQPPTGVAVHLHNGTQVPVELAYGGRHRQPDTGNWEDIWIVTASVRLADLATMTAETLPPRSQLRLRVTAEGAP